MTFTHRRRLAACAFVAAVGCAGAQALAAPAQAAPAPRAGATGARTGTATVRTSISAATTTITGTNWADQITRSQEVQFADTHWSWTAWNDPTPVTDGSDQNNYQCAEFVARSMAAAGLIPGLNPNSPQNDYFTYKAPNGKVYDLLLITPLPQYNTIYDYLMDSGLGIDVGDQPALAQPGDFVVTYLGTNNEASHMGVIATAQIGTTEPTVDAHNRARYHYGYHYYEPSHLVELAPNALARARAWAEKGGAAPGTSTKTVQPNTAQPNTGQPNVTVRPFADPAGPQV